MDRHTQHFGPPHHSRFISCGHAQGIPQTFPYPAPRQAAQFSGCNEIFSMPCHRIRTRLHTAISRRQQNLKNQDNLKKQRGLRQNCHQMPALQTSVGGGHGAGCASLHVQLPYDCFANLLLLHLPLSLRLHDGRPQLPSLWPCF